MSLQDVAGTLLAGPRPMATTRLGFSFTAVKTAIVLGDSPQHRAGPHGTRGRPARSRLLGPQHPGRVQLALNTRAAVPDVPCPPVAASAGLTELLCTQPLLTWVDSLLGRLGADTRDLWRTVRPWITVGGNTERTGQVLGIHAQTVRDHVRGAEPVLERELLAAGSDLYEVVLAHLALGDIEQPAVGRAKRDHPDVTVHK